MRYSLLLVKIKEMVAHQEMLALLKLFSGNLDTEKAAARCWINGHSFDFSLARLRLGSFFIAFEIELSEPLFFETFQ
jgi:hypothetical protein